VGEVSFFGQKKDEDSRYWALPEGGMGSTLLGGRSMIWSFSSSFGWKMTLLDANSSAAMVSDHFYEVPGGYNSD